jgi:hypothetical protein
MLLAILGTMPRNAIEITLTTEQKQQLERIVRSRSAERRLVGRAQIILECATGRQNQEVYLHRSRSWCTSANPEFTEKSANIIGL